MNCIDIIRKIKYTLECIYNFVRRPFFGELALNSRIGTNVKIYNKKNIYLGEYTNIDSGAVIMNTRANFIMKKYSGAAFGLTVITGGHISLTGMWFKTITDKIKDKVDKEHTEDQDIVVEEDVWIGARVSLLKGAHIGRGAVIGSGSVVRSFIPPYSIVIGNPAKVVGFKFTPEEVVMHEEKLYPIEERLPYDLIVQNYKKYFTNKIVDIKKITKI